MRKLFLIFTSVSCLSSAISAQELNCTVQVYYDKIQSQTEKKVMEALQQSIVEFMNNRKWTADPFKQEERILANIIITLTDKLSSDDFKGSIEVKASRPVFNTSYKSLIFNYIDNEFQFKYLEYQTMEFSETSNLALVQDLMGHQSPTSTRVYAKIYSEDMQNAHRDIFH